MKHPTEYRVYTVCTVCNVDESQHRCQMVDTSNHLKSICSNCGATGQFKDVIKKWVSKSVWYKPWTYSDGYWLVAGGSHE